MATKKAVGRPPKYKSKEEIEEKIGLPVLGVVPFKPTLKGGNK